MHTQTQAEHRYPQPREVVFDLLSTAETMPKICTSWGPIAAIVDVAMVDDAPVATGAHRTVRMSDGVVLDEEILAFERPVLHRYTWRGGLKPPFSWLVRGATGQLAFADAEEGTLLTWSYRFDLTSPLALPFAALVMPLFRAWMRQALANAAQQLAKES